MYPTATGDRMFRRLLVMRYLAFNLAGAVLLALAWRYGLFERIWEADFSRLSVVIAAIFLWATGLGGWRAWRLSRDLDRLRDGLPSEKADNYTSALRRGVAPEVAAEALRARLLERVAFLRHAGSVLVTLGLVGTVIGFIIALSGVNPATVGDVAAIAPMVAQLIQGMGVALYTTLVGAILGIWTSANHRLLATGAATLYATILESVPCSTKIPERSFVTS